MFTGYDLSLSSLKSLPYFRASIYTCTHTHAKCIYYLCISAVTIYVRKEEEKVYNALMLENLTMTDLKDAVRIYH